MQFIADQAIFAKLDKVCFAAVGAYGIDNSKGLEEIEDLLQKSITQCENYYQGQVIKQSREVAPYREAFLTLGINPNKYMSSIEALLTRIAKGKGLPGINPVVDLANAVSLKHWVPIGAHDMDTIKNDTYIRQATQNDYFIPFGQSQEETVEEGEIVYATGNSVRTRRWIWRQSEEGKITKDSKNIFFPIDGFTDANKEQLMAAQDELATLLKRFFGCKIKTGWVDVEKNRALL